MDGVVYWVLYRELKYVPSIPTLEKNVGGCAPVYLVARLLAGYDLLWLVGLMDKLGVSWVPTRIQARVAVTDGVAVAVTSGVCIVSYCTLRNRHRLLFATTLSLPFHF